MIFLNNSRAQNHPPISPKWVFEPMVWEDENNTREAVDSLIKRYQRNKIPVGAVIIDSPWEARDDSTVSYNETSNNGYNTFVFNEDWYPNPKGFIDRLRNEDSLHVILWITGIIDTGCNLWQDAHDKGYFVKFKHGGDITQWWKGSRRASHIDFFKDSAKTFWEEQMDLILNDYEVDGWKVDWSDVWLRDSSFIITAKGVKTTGAYSNEYYSEMYNYIKSKKDSGMILARPYCLQDDWGTGYFFAPKSVNTAGWVGDQWNTWNATCGLQLALNNIFISADSGYATVGFDIGGYRNAWSDEHYFPPDRILFLRWAQLGALMPIMENGGNKDSCHQPWLFSPVISDG